MAQIIRKWEEMTLLLITEASCPHCDRKSVVKTDQVVRVEITSLTFVKKCPGCEEEYQILAKL